MKLKIHGFTITDVELDFGQWTARYIDANLKEGFYAMSDEGISYSAFIASLSEHLLRSLG